MAEANSLTPAQVATVGRALQMVAGAPEVGPSYNCTEADALAEGMRVFGLNPNGFLSTHAEADDDGDGHRTCDDCTGSGRAFLADPAGGGEWIPCPECRGAGWLSTDDASPVIPAHFPVQPISRTSTTAQQLTTCGVCGRSWDDSIPTAYTPAPAGRCPFEYFHAEKG